MTDTAPLLTLLREALDMADAVGDTLVAAMLAECIDAVERGAGSRLDTA